MNELDIARNENSGNTRSSRPVTAIRYIHSVDILPRCRRYVVQEETKKKVFFFVTVTIVVRYKAIRIYKEQSLIYKKKTKTYSSYSLLLYVLYHLLKQIFDGS